MYRSKLNSQYSGIIDYIDPNQNVTVKKMVKGFGFIDISFLINTRGYELEKTVRGFLIGYRLLIIPKLNNLIQI